MSTEQEVGIGRQLYDAAGAPFVIAAFVLPLVAAVVAAGVRNQSLLNLVHVMSAAIWAGATVFVAGVFGPTLQELEPDVRSTVNLPLIPKNTFLFSGVAIATLLTGPMLAVSMGVWDLSNPYILAAVLIGLALLGGALALVRLQISVFDEFKSPGEPDVQRVGQLAGRIGKISPVMLVLQLAILVVMTLLRTGT